MTFTPSYNGPDFQWQVRVLPSGVDASRAFDRSTFGVHFDLGSSGFIKCTLSRQEADLWSAHVLAWSDWSKHSVLVNIDSIGAEP